MANAAAPAEADPTAAATAGIAAPAPAPTTTTTTTISFSITELAREFEITPRTIRFYEDMGLLSPGRAGRNRVYSPRDRTRLKLTLRGKRLGFALQEIRQLVTMYDTESDIAPQLQAFLDLLAAHKSQLAQQLDDIRVTLDELTLHEARCQQLLVAANRVRKKA